MIDRRSVCIGCGILAGLGARHSRAQGNAAEQPLGPFTPLELAAARGIYRDGVTGMFQDMLKGLAPGLRARLRDVSLDVPDEAPINAGFALQVYSTPSDGRVVMPLRTVLWLDQYAGLTTHLRRQGCNNYLGLCMLYSGMLQTHRSATVRPPGPLAAFGLTDAIYDDSAVKSLTAKVLDSTIFFLLAHELGHIWHRHEGGLTGIRSLRQEREADAFALDVLAGVKVFPLGLAILFTASAMMEGEQNTHPPSGTRVAAVADVLDQNAAAFVEVGRADPQASVRRYKALADEVKTAVPIVDDFGHAEVDPGGGARCSLLGSTEGDWGTLSGVKGGSGMASTRSSGCVSLEFSSNGTAAGPLAPLRLWLRYDHRDSNSPRAIDTIIYWLVRRLRSGWENSNKTSLRRKGLPCSFLSSPSDDELVLLKRHDARRHGTLWLGRDAR